MNHKKFSKTERNQIIRDMSAQPLDVLVTGGGINGAISIASCAKAGLRCGLVEKNDFASNTSQSSSNLIWGGIKYLENFEFPLVMKLCASRNRLMKNFPANVKEIRFFTLHQKKFKYPLWFLYLGTWVYQCLGRFVTEPPKLISAAKLAIDAPIVNQNVFDGGFAYSDAMLPESDARFTLEFILNAVKSNAHVLNYCALTAATYEKGLWHCTLETADRVKFNVQTKTIVNAAGPDVDRLNKKINVRTNHRHVFSKGIHLIFPRTENRHRILTFFADDGRLFFSVPMGDKTCVGTTDTMVDAPNATVTDEDRDFLLHNINKNLNPANPLTKKDVISERCGVRPLVVEKSSKNGKSGDWFKLSRKHVISIDSTQKFLSIFGGKLTDCLNIGEEVLHILKDRFRLPVRTVNLDEFGEPGDREKRAFLERCVQLNVDRQSKLLGERLWRRYYNRTEPLLELIETNPDLLEPIGPGIDIYKIEEEMACLYEMAMTRQDFLRRRTLGEMIYPADTLSKCALNRF